MNRDCNASRVYGARLAMLYVRPHARGFRPVASLPIPQLLTILRLKTPTHVHTLTSTSSHINERAKSS